MQPVNFETTFKTSINEEHLLKDHGSNNNIEFAKMLSGARKKILKKPDNDSENKELQEKNEHLSIDNMNYYNHNAKESQFYMRMATTDIKC